MSKLKCILLAMQMAISIFPEVTVLQVGPEERDPEITAFMSASPTKITSAELDGWSFLTRS